MIWVNIAVVDLMQELVQRVFQNMVVFPKNYICLLKLKLLNVCCFNLSSINLSFRTEKKHCLSGNLSQVLIGLAHEISIKHFLKRSSLAGSRNPTEQIFLVHKVVAQVSRLQLKFLQMC